ncbi:DUF58 domain-containing protein [Dolichospermum sp. ST_con]|nr:DUF58 domain-containing protein [Dolichospermum sp. ST_con]MDD1419626.1 DUF58 domain-containing protein [Dolichospermum sp. ST_sed1]MDD1425665.1 DUF58 domain-containing protein [Dolichospermum sp. ST_sed9]MDD1431821.1 DUF58 domain-containing protein [Dolichospermum sp. ST_sed6]MDD1440520.1 DUF58 domain-containing protein [Dolichospermum sp. ST_sed3]MDD1446466.1 DUF58 domain-containing protein [Dolichospermum sp. ST_sed8]MDD1455190.1 DUF58 domain-containing protein [Dolichospermum sp. ST_se
MIPAKKVYFLLIAGIFIAPILSMIVGIFPTIIITCLFDLTVFILMVVDGWGMKANRVQITRELPSRLSIGRDNSVVLKVQGGKIDAVIRIRDYYPAEFAVSTPTVTANINANQTQELTYTVYPNQRGEFAWGNMQVRQLGMWGLVWHDWQIPQSTQVKVYPDLVGLRSLSIRLTLQSSGSIRKIRQMGIGTEFAELRNYRSGDDLRFIDWKATARRSYGNTGPLIRVLEPEQEQTLLILLDRGRLMTAKVQGLQRFDWGLNTTLSLALAGLHRGDRVGVGVFDRQLHTWIPPERGQNHLNQLIDKLTPIQPELIESDYLGAVTHVVKQQTRRALVVVITDLVDITASSELLAALTRLAPRYLPFCVTLRDPQVDNLAHTFTEDATQSYVRAVALDLLAQRQLAFAQLKQKGVLVLDAPANQISEQLVDRYLQLKARNQL